MDSLKNLAKTTARKLTTRSGWLGDRGYNYANLFLPQFPYTLPKQQRKVLRPSPFFSLDSNLPILILLITGLQHALACLAGGVWADAYNCTLTLSLSHYTANDNIPDAEFSERLAVVHDIGITDMQRHTLDGSNAAHRT